VTHWKWARFDTLDLEPAGIEAATQWVRGLGLDPANLRTAFCVSQDTDGQFRAHFSEYLRDGQGRFVIDHAQDVVATRPIVVDLPAAPVHLAHVLTASS
jgi:hypothetical protein